MSRMKWIMGKEMQYYAPIRCRATPICFEFISHVEPSSGSSDNAISGQPRFLRVEIKTIGAGSGELLFLATDTSHFTGSPSTSRIKV